MNAMRLIRCGSKLLGLAMDLVRLIGAVLDLF